MLLDSILYRLMFPFLFDEEGGGGGDDSDDADDSKDKDDGDDDEGDDDDADLDEGLSDPKFDVDQAKELIRKQRKSERDALKAQKKAEKERDALLAEKKKADDLEKTELEKSQGRVGELETENAELKIQLQETRLNHSIQHEASLTQFTVGEDKDKKYRFLHPDMASKLIMADDDLFKLLEYDDETGEAKGITRALKALAKDYENMLDLGGKLGPDHTTPRPDERRRTDMKPEVLDEQPAEKVIGVTSTF